MKLIVGLGNPGGQYENTRHNVGFLVLEKLKTETSNFQLENKFKAEVCRTGDIILAKPTTFMNESGAAVSKIANFFKVAPDDIYVIHDDLDLRLGEYKTQKGVGPKLHYGIRSIERKLGSSDFWRIRIGVDNRDPKNRTQGEAYVLQKFTEEERVIINKTIDKLLIDFMANQIQRINIK